MKIVIGSDHAGFALKNAMGDVLRGLGNAVLDVGAFNENPSDYPDFAEAVGRAVLDGGAGRPDLRQRSWSECCREQASGNTCGGLPRYVFGASGRRAR